MMKEDCAASVPLMTCKVCGDTKPKHGFFPLISFSMTEDFEMIDSSPYTCNKCALSDEDYKKIFKEKKQ